MFKTQILRQTKKIMQESLHSIFAQIYNHNLRKHVATNKN